MSADTTLAKLDAGRTALAAARSVFEVKQLRDQATTIEHWLKRRGASLDLQNDAAEFRLRAERKLGALLKETVVPRGNHGGVVGASKSLPDGITKKQSHQWQCEAEVDDDNFERWVAETCARGEELTSAGLLRIWADQKKARERQEQVARGGPEEADAYRLITGDFTTVSDIAPASVDAVITDPPYERDFLPMFEPLAECAATWLRPGGSLLVMCGCLYLPEIYAALTKHLTYYWTLAYVMPGCTMRPRSRRIHQQQKPLLWFVKGAYSGGWVKDVVTSGGRDKRFHDWGQDEGGFVQIVERLTNPGDLVLDPCCGAGTTGVAALCLGRRFIGIDTDETALRLTAARLAQVPADQADQEGQAA
jgi:site-specific DNA-methyltransferase (adenine-specific)